MPGEVVMETAQLVFRLWTDGDLPLAMRLWGDADVMSFLGRPMSEEAAGERLEQEQRTWRDHGGAVLAYLPAVERRAGGVRGLTPWE